MRSVISVYLIIVLFKGLVASNFDPFLPCNSHHIRSSRRRAAQQQQSISISSQTTTQQQSSSPVQSVQINVVQSGRPMII